MGDNRMNRAQVHIRKTSARKKPTLLFGLEGKSGHQLNMNL
jgi:hypothetical protein